MSQSKGVALVTGSAQGIGRAIAIRLAQDGFDVALNDLSAKIAVLEDLATELQSIGKSDSLYNPRICIVAGDVGEEVEVKRMIDTAVDVLGSLDVVSNKCRMDDHWTQDVLLQMVANAGIAATGDILTGA